MCLNSLGYFFHNKRKIILIKTFTHRALIIYSESTLDSVNMFYSETLANNSFPFSVIQKVIANKITEFNKCKHAPLRECLVYLRLWLGAISEWFA